MIEGLNLSDINKTVTSLDHFNGVPSAQKLASSTPGEVKNMHFEKPVAIQKLTPINPLSCGSHISPGKSAFFGKGGAFMGMNN